jgi:hypothetical protein
MKGTNRKRLNGWPGAVALCLALLACGAPVEPSTPTTGPTATRKPIATRAPTQTLSFAPSRTPTSMPTPTPTGTPASPADGSEQSPGAFQGCWQYETEDVSLDIELEQQGADVQGTFFLIKVCVVEGIRSACRIREGFIEGIVARDELRIRLSIPEYDDEGAASLKLADEGQTLSWEELEYPEMGLSDGGPHYLPSRFTLTPCDV